MRILFAAIPASGGYSEILSIFEGFRFAAQEAIQLATESTSVTCADSTSESDKLSEIEPSGHRKAILL